MGRDAIWRGIPRPRRWLGALAPLALAAAAGVPLEASASSESYGLAAASAAAGGVVFGGQTSQGWPMFLEMKNRRVLARAVIGFDAPCTSGNYYTDWYTWVRVRVNRRHRFSARFGPVTQRYDDGTTADFWGEISGGVNRARSTISGRAQVKAVYYDTAAAVTDTCDSGRVRWTAKQ